MIKPGTVSNEIFAHEDMLPTLLAVAGVPDVKEKLLKGYKAGDKTFKVHLDGYNLLPFLKGEVKESPRKEMLYWSDDGDLMALRYGKLEGRVQGAARGELRGLVGADGRAARAEDLQPAQRSVREGGQELHLLQRLAARRVFLLVPAQGFVAKWIQSFKEFPPSQKPASFSIDQVMEKLTSPARRTTRHRRQ